MIERGKVDLPKEAWHLWFDAAIAMTDELPLDVILSIQRILDLKATSSENPLDVLDNNFNPVDILNNFFPDGKQRLPYISPAASSCSL